MEILNLFLLLYVIPVMVCYLGAREWYKEFGKPFVSARLLMFTPAINLLFAYAMAICLLISWFTRLLAKAAVLFKLLESFFDNFGSKTKISDEQFYRIRKKKE